MSQVSKGQLFSRYEELKIIIRNAEKEIEELKPAIIELVPEGKEVEGAEGVFSVQPRATWKFSKETEALGKTLKEKQEEEKAKGIAKAKYTPVLYYNAKKKEGEE